MGTKAQHRALARTPACVIPGWHFRVDHSWLYTKYTCVISIYSLALWLSTQRVQKPLTDARWPRALCLRAPCPWAPLELELFCEVQCSRGPRAGLASSRTTGDLDYGALSSSGTPDLCSQLDDCRSSPYSKSECPYPKMSIGITIVAGGPARMLRSL